MIIAGDIHLLSRSITSCVPALCSERLDYFLQIISEPKRREQ